MICLGLVNWKRMGLYHSRTSEKFLTQHTWISLRFLTSGNPAQTLGRCVCVCVCVKSLETVYPTRDGDERSHDNAQGIFQDFGGWRVLKPHLSHHLTANQMLWLEHLHVTAVGSVAQPWDWLLTSDRHTKSSPWNMTCLKVQHARNASDIFGPYSAFIST